MTGQLQRKLNLTQATSLNMIDMVGIGPFICLPFVMANAGGMYLWAWVAGAILSFIDAAVWSELGTAYPLAGGSYNFLNEAYGKKGAGKLMSFLYVWQTLIQAPLVAASAAIGFSQYLGYLVHLEDWGQKAVSGAVIIFITILLYRKIEGIGKIGTVMWVCVLATIGWIIFAGISYGNFIEPVKHINDGFSWQLFFSFAFGQACVKTIYSYLGYYNICHLGGEIKSPEKNIPKSMFISVIGIAILYLCMNISVSSVMPWQTIAAMQGTDNEKYVVSLFMDEVYKNSPAGIIVTVLILIVALSSLFAVLLGYTRVPYAAAANGRFLPIFAKLHPTKNFPHVSLLILAGIAFIFSLLLKMEQVISGILAMRIIIQFVGQAVGVILLRKRTKGAHLKYKMPLYPLPVILAVAIWLLIFIATKLTAIMYFGIVAATGLVVYMIIAKRKNDWPFSKS